jgi:hypothetical protein
VGKARPGGFRGSSGLFSIWRIPNFLLEPRGKFLGERVPVIDTLNRVRSLLGTLMLIGIIVYYSGLSHLTDSTPDEHGATQRTVTANTPEGHWIVAIILSAVLAAFMIPLVALILVLCARKGARLATLYQMRWPALGIAAFFGLLAVLGPLLDGANLLAMLAKEHGGILAKVGAYFFTLAVAILALVWLVKALYFAATGLFRADDGHPFLALIVAPCVATLSSVLMLTQGSDGLSDVPTVVGWVTGLGGPISITGLSIASVFILRDRYPGDFPFRGGPLWAAVPSQPAPAPATV